MANTTIALRSSGVTGNVPSLGVIANGELSLNFADGIIYYKTASNTLGSIRTTQPAGLTKEIQFNDSGSFGANSALTFDKTTGTLNVTNINTTTNLTANNITTGNGAGGVISGANVIYANNFVANSSGQSTFNGPSTFNGTVLFNTVGGDEGGEILLGKPTSNTSLVGTGVTIDVWQNRLRIFEQGGTARGVYVDLTAASDGVGSNLLGGGVSGVSSVGGQTGAVSNTQILSGILTVDGAGSGLDADLLDGQHASYYSTNAYAISAFTQANTANTNAVNAGTYANAAFAQANTANTSALAAFTQANTANTSALAAFTQANTANTTSISAGIYANAAFVQANTANTSALAAFSQANTANTNAVNAGTYANAAFEQANTSNTNAVNAGTYANAAFAQANTANTNAVNADTKAQSAWDQANTANTLAGTKYNTTGGEISGDVVITGNLTIQGTQLVTSTASLAISDNMLYLNNAIAANVSNAVGNGTSVVYTTSINHGYQVGMYITVTGVTPSSLNISGASNTLITAVTSNTFTITSSVTDTYVSGGVARAKTAANPDLGFAAGYNDGTYHHAGLFRDASDGIWKFFDNYTPEPDDSVYIDTNHATFRIANLTANIISQSVTVVGNNSISNTTGAIKVTGGIGVQGNVSVDAIIFPDGTSQNTASAGGGSAYNTSLLFTKSDGSTANMTLRVADTQLTSALNSVYVPFLLADGTTAKNLYVST